MEEFSMRNKKNEVEGLMTEVVYAAIYCGALFALVFLIAR
jgi:hypothetical protein